MSNGQVAHIMIPYAAHLPHISNTVLLQAHAMRLDAL